MLVDQLELDVMTAGVCLPCLTFVAFPLDSGDERQARREARKLTPDLWEEGLELAVLVALETAKRDGVSGAAAAIEDVQRHGTPVARRRRDRVAARRTARRGHQSAARA